MILLIMLKNLWVGGGGGLKIGKFGFGVGKMGVWGV